MYVAMFMYLLKGIIHTVALAQQGTYFMQMPTSSYNSLYVHMILGMSGFLVCRVQGIMICGEKTLRYG